MKLKTMTWCLAAGVLSFVTCCATIPVQPSAQDPGGEIAFLVRQDMTPASEDAEYWFLLKFDDGSSFERRISLKAGTPIRTATSALSTPFLEAGFQVTTIPVLGAVKIEFMPGLKEVNASGGEGFVFSDTTRRRGSVADGQ